MIENNVNTSSSGAGMDKLRADMLDLMNLDVLVGIPEDKAPRKRASKVNNAQLLYIHTNGSELQGIPRRPVIEPAIKAHRDEIQKELALAAKFALEGNIKQAKAQLKIAGLAGANASRDWFTDPRNGWPPNSEETIVEKLRKQASGSGEPAKIARAAVSYYENVGSLKSITGLEGMTNPLIDTDQMRKSITFVIREKNK